MSRFLLLLLCSSLIPSGGCTICQHHEDLTYAAFGGVWERQDPIGGRVGSAFDPAEGPYSGGRRSDPPPLDPENGEYPDEYELDDRFQTSRTHAR
jgi:hypothetical protein